MTPGMVAGIALTTDALDGSDALPYLLPSALLLTVYGAVRLDRRYRAGEIEPRSRWVRWLLEDSDTRP